MIDPEVAMHDLREDRRYYSLMDWILGGGLAAIVAVLCWWVL